MNFHVIFFIITHKNSPDNTQHKFRLQIANLKKVQTGYFHSLDLKKMIKIFKFYYYFFLKIC